MSKKSIFCCLFTSIIAVFLLLLPSLLSTEIGNRLVLSWLVTDKQEQLRVGHFSLSWLGPQKIKTLTLRENGHKLLKLKSFEANTSLPIFLLRGPKPHEVSLELLHVNLEKQHLESSLIKALAPRSSLESLFSFLGEKVELRVSQSSEENSSWRMEFLSDQVHLFCDITLDDKLVKLTSPIKLETHFADHPLTIEIDNLEFPLSALSEPLSSDRKKEISFDARVTFASKATLQLSSRKGAEDFFVNANDVPTKLLDTLLDTKDLFQEILGQTLSLNLRSDEKEATRLSFTLDTEKIDIPEGTLQLNQNLGFSGSFSTKKISFKNAKSTPIALENSSFFWNLNPRSNLLSIHLENPISADAEIDLGAKGLARLRSLDIKGKNVPSALLDFPFSHSFHVALFGDKINSRLLFQQKNGQGTVDIEVKGDLGEVRVDARIENGVLVLNKPLTLTTQATETLGTKLLSEFSPLFLQLENSNQQIRFSISPEEFSLPLTTFDLKNIRIHRAVLDAGKLSFKNAGEIKKSLKALKPPKTDSVEIWTTPVYMTFEKGKLTIERTDVLMMNRYPVAIWGKIDFSKDKVRMTIGLTAKALSEAFDLQGLDKKFVLQIPVTGSVKKAKVDSSKATRKIGALIAQKSKSPEALLVGAVLGLVNGKEEKPPAPTTSPFPWDAKNL